MNIDSQIGPRRKRSIGFTTTTNKKFHFYVNGTHCHTSKVAQSNNADFTVHNSDRTTLVINNAGLYVLTYIDQVKSTFSAYLKLILDKKFTTSPYLTTMIPQTSGNNPHDFSATIMFYAQQNTSLSIESTAGWTANINPSGSVSDFRGVFFIVSDQSYIMIAKQD